MLPKWYFNYKEIIDNFIIQYLDNYFDKQDDKNLDIFKESVYYSLKWWKRIRAILALEFYLVNSNRDINNISINDDIIKYCLALEFIQAYSLIHDDLPCMDNDEYRRWELSTWKKYWDDTATLVWDLLNSLAFEIIWESNKNKIWLELTKLLWKSIWYYWMLWWQILDIYYEWKSNELDLDKLINLHNKKTWALINASVIWWLILSWKEFNLEKYNNFWYKIWLAFQVKDDLNEKDKNKWYIEQKWFVYFIWEDKTKEYLKKLNKECLELIKDLKSSKLDEIVNYISLI